jgi:hypothetical protein
MTGTLDTTTKEALRKTIRELRERLLDDLHGATEGEYQLSVKPERARLTEAQRVRRARLEAWLDEQVRSVPGKEQKEARVRFRRQAEKEAAYTLLHRLVVLRQLEAYGLVRPAVIAGSANDWKESQALRELREHAPELCEDETEGFAFLLELVFGELALDLPGLFGEVGVTSLVRVPTPTLKAVVEALASPELTNAWSDDTTLGWIYQYWNDPDREALDAKIHGGGKIGPHEIASKTQMFTERYMVEWLLQNSLGLTWLAMCKKHGWTADAEAVLPALDARRAEWRAKRDAGEVALDALMPIEGELEEHWKYYVPQPIPDDAVSSAPDSVRALELLDPACGSGHFLVIAFDMLAALYREEARHRGERWSDREIAESILEKNLFGIDIDPRAIQIAAAALYLKARSRVRDVRPRQLNLVAPVFRLGNLPANDPAVVQLREELAREAGVPAELTNKLLASLAGVDHLGSLLRVSAEVDAALKNAEVELEKKRGQGDLFTGEFPAQQVKLTLDEARATVLDRLETFLAHHTSAEDLGLRLDGEQLAAGVRFVRMAREGVYDVVVGNPPYQGLSKTESFGYVKTTYPRGKADLYAAFLERGLQLAREGGLSALLTMRGWMFLGQFTELRKTLLHAADLRTLGDLDKGAFESMRTSQLLSVSLSVFRRASASGLLAVALQPTAPDEKFWGSDRTDLKRAAVLAQVGRYDFDPRGFEVIDGEPIVYWWTKEFLQQYAAAPKLGEIARVRQGMATADNARFVRRTWEIDRSTLLARQYLEPVILDAHDVRRFAWVPYIKGAAGTCWFEPLEDVLAWRRVGFEVKLYNEFAYGSASRNIKNEPFYFQRGIAFSMIGASFKARAHRYASVIGHMGSSVFGDDVEGTLCSMNSATARGVLGALNPGVHFEVGDVARLPRFPVAEAAAIVARLDQAFTENEAGSESSTEFRQPRCTAWKYAQHWAQRSVDRLPGAPLPPWDPVFEPAPPVSFVSFAVGVVLGRFGPNGEGIVTSAPSTALAAGILFVSAAEYDSLDHPACAPLHAAWTEHGGSVGQGADLRDYLARSFFAYHKTLYENRPIYFPLSSAKKNFVAFISIHRWTDTTLQTLLADHLLETRKRFVGEIADLGEARAGTDKKRAREAERRYAQLAKWMEELDDFIAKVKECAERGAPPVDGKCPPREVDAPFHMDLDDGVMINSAALWPLLEPQWKDPKKWWRELASAPPAGSTTKAKDYDWAHLAKRYWPTRVEEKCKLDPSLGVAHGCFWKYHPQKAYAWELRLQHEMADPAFRIDEEGSDDARAAFLRDHADEAREIEEKEQKRRARKKNAEDDAPLLRGIEDDGEDAEADNDEPLEATAE